MDKAELNHIKEMERLRVAINITDSPLLKKDYNKALNRMKRELKEYRSYKRGE